MGNYSDVVFVLVGWAVILFITRIRGAALVTAGRVSRAELDGFLVRVFVVFGLLFVFVGVLQALSSERDIFCLIVFPPKNNFGVALLIGQIVVSSSVVLCVWTRNSADLLSRLAPLRTPIRRCTGNGVQDRRIDRCSPRCYSPGCRCGSCTCRARSRAW